MRNFRKIVLMLAVLIGMETIMGFLLEPVTYQHTLNRELKYMKEQGWEPDMVLLGDSMVACGLVPGAMEETLGGEFCVLNAATGSQQVWGSYYYLKDLMELYDLRCVVMGVDQWAFTEQEKSIKRDLIVLDRIKNPWIKMQYISNIFEPAEYPYLLKSYANREEFEKILVHAGEKLTREYLFGKKLNLAKSDLERGHTSNGTGMGEEMVGINRLDAFTADSVDQRAIEYLDQIVRLCSDKNVKLYLIGMPTTSASVYATDTYEEFWNFFEEYAQRKEISFWDMNLLKDRMEVIPDGMMFDTVHVGSPGDRFLSRKMGELLCMDLQGRNVSDAFWTFSEWKRNQKGIVGCDLFTEEIPQKKDRLMRAVSLQSDGIVPEYEFWISDGKNSGEWTKLQEYGVGDTCVVPGEYFENDVRMKVCVREKGSNVPYEKCCVRTRDLDMGE